VPSLDYRCVLGRSVSQRPLRVCSEGRGPRVVCGGAAFFSAAATGPIPLTATHQSLSPPAGHAAPSTSFFSPGERPRRFQPAPCPGTECTCIAVRLAAWLQRTTCSLTCGDAWPRNSLACSQAPLGHWTCGRTARSLPARLHPRETISLGDGSKAPHATVPAT